MNLIQLLHIICCWRNRTCRVALETHAHFKIIDLVWMSKKSATDYHFNQSAILILAALETNIDLDKHFHSINPIWPRLTTRPIRQSDCNRFKSTGYHEVPYKYSLLGVPRHLSAPDRCLGVKRFVAQFFWRLTQAFLIDFGFVVGAERRVEDILRDSGLRVSETAWQHFNSMIKVTRT